MFKINFLTACLPAVVYYSKKHGVHFTWSDIEPFITLFLCGVALSGFLDLLVIFLKFLVDIFNKIRYNKDARGKSKAGGSSPSSQATVNNIKEK